MEGTESVPSLDEMWRMLQEERAQGEAQAAELAQLKCKLAEQREEKTALADRLARMEQSASRPRKRVSRAGLLKAAAAGAVGLVAAELNGSMGADPAFAYDQQDNFFASGGHGAAYTVGQGLGDPTSNYDYGLWMYLPANKVGIYVVDAGDAGADVRGNTGVRAAGSSYGVDASADNDGSTGVNATGGNTGYGLVATTNNGYGWSVYATTIYGYGVHSQATNSAGIPVYGEGPNLAIWGYGGKTGVYGQADSESLGTGVLGEVKDHNGNLGVGYAVKGNAGDGIGVQGNSRNGIGVNGIASGGTGGVFQGGLTPLRLVPGKVYTTGYPTDVGHSTGDLFVDGNGVLYFCYQASGDSGLWKTLNAVVPITPVRVLDTRTGTGGYNGPQGVGAILTLTLPGTHGIPAPATGVIGTLRAYAPTGPGYLTAYPGSGTPPTASNVNFYPNPDYPTSYAVADQVTVGFYQNQLSIYVGGPPGSSTQVVFDVSGYIQ